jgi:hypothetical protein
MTGGPREQTRRFRVNYSHKRPPYWEVTHSDGRWWSVAYRADENNRALYLITAGNGRLLDPHGPTGQKVLDAVHDFERNT